MLSSSILLSALFAGLVAIGVTMAIEKWGGLIGGLLGTLPSTIVPAAIGMHVVGGEEALQSSMSIVPLGMLLNALFLGVWMVLPPYLAGRQSALLFTTIAALGVWALLGAAMLWIVGSWLQPSLSVFAIGWLGFALVFVVAIAFNRRPQSAPKGAQKVSFQVLAGRGIAAALAIGAAVWLSGQGHPLLAGLASVFPAIFLTSMVALWLAQGPTVPRGAAGPMMLGGVSVAVYANIAMWSLPTYGMLWGTVLAWCLAVGGWSLPTFLIVRRLHQKANLND